MKNQNKIYLPLKKQGIKKAWNKAVIVKIPNDDYFQLVVFWQKKPFAYWGVKDITDIDRLRVSLYSMIDFYEHLDMAGRRNSKAITKYLLSKEFQKIESYKNANGDLVKEV